MFSRWYVYIIIAVVAEILLWFFGKRKFIKSKTLRLIVALFISSLICWGICDLFFCPE